MKTLTLFYQKLSSTHGGAINTSLLKVSLQPIPPRKCIFVVIFSVLENISCWCEKIGFQETSKFFISCIVMSQRYHFQEIQGWKVAEITYLLEMMSTGYQETEKLKAFKKGVKFFERDSSLAVFTDI